MTAKEQTKPENLILDALADDQEPENIEELDEQDLVLPEDIDIKAIQAAVSGLVNQFRYTVSHIPPIDAATWRKALEKSVIDILRNIDPDKLPADLLENETVQTLADQIRSGDLEQAKETIFHISAATFMKLLDTLPEYVKDDVPQENAVILQEKVYTEINERLTFPLDKVNRHFFQLWEELTTAPDGQIFFDVTPRVQQKDIQPEDRSTITLSLKKRGTHAAPLTEYDRRVMLAAHALDEKNNNRPFTLQALYEQMGNSGSLGSNNRERLLSSLNSQYDHWIDLDNTQETVLQKNRKKFVYHGSFLPFEYVDEYENGQVTNVHVHLLRTPPMIELAKDRNQVTTISRELLSIPMSQTEINLRLQHYLISEISRIKRGGRNNKMLYKTIFEETGQTSRKQQARAKEKIKVILDHFIAENYISRYKLLPDGVEIIYKKTTPADKPKRRRKKTV